MAHRKTLLLLASWACLCLAGCGAPGAPPGDSRAAVGAERTADLEARPDDGALAVPELPFALERASSGFSAGWSAAEAVQRAGGPELPADLSVVALNAWASEVLGPWVVRTRESIESVEERFASIPEDARSERLVAAAVTALLWADFARTFVQAPVPDEIRDEPELLGIYLGALHDQSSPLRRRARQLLAGCAELATEAPALSLWREHCESSGADIERLENEAPRAGPRRLGSWRAPGRPAATEPPEAARPGPARCWAESEPPRREEPPSAVAVVPAAWWRTTAPLPAPTWAALASEVRARLADALHLPVLSERETSRMLRVWQQGRAAAGGPVCAAPAPLADVLRRLHPGATLAKVAATCGDDGCRVSVSLDPATRGPLPGRLQSPVAGDPVLEESWTVAASRLAPTESSAGILGVLRQLPSDLRVEVRQPLGSWGSTDLLRTAIEGRRTALAGCVGADDPPGSHRFIVTADEAGRLAVQTEPSPASEVPRRQRTCLERVLDRVRVPAASGPRHAVVEIAFPGVEPPSPPDGIRVQIPGHGQLGLRSAIAECYTAHRPAADGVVALSSTLGLDRRGRVQDVSFEPIEESGSVPEALATCVARHLRSTRWACPAADASERLVPICIFPTSVAASASESSSDERER